VLGFNLAGEVVEVALLKQDGVVLEVLPPALLEDDHQPVAVHRLDDQRRAELEHVQELAERLPAPSSPR
jgi:hypothetical protein